MFSVNRLLSLTKVPGHLQTTAYYVLCHHLFQGSITSWDLFANRRWSHNVRLRGSRWSSSHPTPSLLRSCAVDRRRHFNLSTYSVEPVSETPWTARPFPCSPPYGHDPWDCRVSFGDTWIQIGLHWNSCNLRNNQTPQVSFVCW